MEYYSIDPYIEEELDQFNEWYKIEGINKIKELSRQLRTLFNYKSEVIKHRYGLTLSPAVNYATPTFLTRKQKIEELTLEFLKLLKVIKENAQTLEQGIQNLFFLDNTTRLIELSKISELLFILIHEFSEKSLHRYPNFLKFIVILANYLCLIKKCLNAQFSEFFEELGKNYKNLEEELTQLFPNQVSFQKVMKEKILEERLRS
ncbi:MAG: hypothetical protein ACXAEX_19190 [Promethearchaeota archaeon]|jgi:hypothetical protein